MLIVNFFLLAFSSFKNSLSRIWQSAKYKSRYPDCKFYPGAILINSELSKYNILFYDVQVINSVVGAHTYIQKRSSVINAQIGKFCSIASDVTIGPGVHKLDSISTHPVFYLNNTPLLKKYADKDLFTASKQTLVGHDVWIGEKAVILDGLTIGTGAVIAAGAVVTKNVAPYSIVAGVPAKLVRMRFTEIETGQILASAWWDNNEKWLENNYKSFSDFASFKKAVGDEVHHRATV